MTGKATFGFFSKYQKGAEVPTGQTEFQFKTGNLNFKSISNDGLVVAGEKAQYKGVGTINGFLFGVVVGVLLVLFFQARGAQFLRGVGIDPERVSQRMEEIQGRFLRGIQTSKETGSQATGAGEKIRGKLNR